MQISLFQSFLCRNGSVIFQYRMLCSLPNNRIGDFLFQSKEVFIGKLSQALNGTEFLQNFQCFFRLSSSVIVGGTDKLMLFVGVTDNDAMIL